MNKRAFVFVLVLASLVFGMVGMPVAAQDAQVFYWISHGTAGDPIWAFAAAGAERAAADLSVEVRVSFHGGDVAAQREAFTAAIAAGAAGIATSSPEPGALTDLVAEAQAAGIPVVYFNTDDPGSGRDAYVGGNGVEVGRQWAQYLVDNGLVESGDFVFMPVEVPGATYQVDETNGIASVFDPLGIIYEVVDAQYDPAASTVNMIDYLTANRDRIDAVIALGDLVAGNIPFAFDQVGIPAGSIPVVGWGNSLQAAAGVRDGYINAAMFQNPDAQGYMPMVLLNIAADGGVIGYNIYTASLYEAADAEYYVNYFGQ
ncbi:MAG: substrate-binding domain-containing protein [Chloroflexi bacterium]|nr:substrate-binding domain-containing protein [Chloroflexota bacterium]